MARWSQKKAEKDGTGRMECVFCGVSFTEQVTLHRHIRQNHRVKGL